MDINVETAKRMLKEEVENAPYVIEESFGNAGPIVIDFVLCGSC